MTLSRRCFCGAVGAGIASANLSLIANDQTSKPLRVVAYNIYKLTGWPSQSPLAQQAVARGQMANRLAMELALYDPDIINFSESPPENVTKEVAKLLGMNHVRFPSGGHWPGTLLSKSKILESQNAPMNGDRPKELFTRHWGRAIVELPGDEPLVVHSAHLFPTPDPAVRLREIRAMIESMKSDFDSGRSMLLIGDLNHSPDTDEYKLWIDAGWTDTFAEVGADNGFTFKSDHPEWRIDYIFAAGPIAKRVSESRPLFDGAFRLNNDDEKSFALSDHLPQLAVFDSVSR
ncbi:MULTISPECIES: endonuclease/exonuclease/phosphatase family protein [Rhodopirellula]|uniref:endonuclease/exonuclease/phosphatase family protein n=1 Tax=Rhodopirellula TaxID=265488 RepID=UPI00257C9F95|nr:endonuclease/exonuclease/phosphatase family protein [Rhodopirellula sp. UBA1907]|tara:strand:+ start:13607 stop:14473 length:867 start_codon:yes stop_codon:yes gene_type:complete